MGRGVGDPQRDRHDDLGPGRRSGAGRHVLGDDKAAERDGARRRNRAAVFDRVGFDAAVLDDDVPLAVMVTRLTGQKGADLLLPIVPLLRTIPLRRRRARLRRGIDRRRRCAAAADGHPTWFAFVEGYDDAFAHLLFGAGDLYLMPSRFEPCGLAQMQAMRYGTIPVVTDVGGLHDTVIDADEHRDGTGFVAPRADVGGADVGAVPRGPADWSNARQRHALINRIMKLDWSWSAPARQYVELYERLAARP